MSNPYDAYGNEVSPPPGPSFPPRVPDQWGARAPEHEQVLVSIGEISCTQHWVYVPHGRFPIKGTAWTVRDQSRLEEKIPAYAIVLAVVFFLFCFLGLLFLLIKERKTVGFVEVEVRGEGLYHVTQLPASHALQSAQVRQMVDYARSLASAA